MSTKIQNITSKGQMTLPAEWRKRFSHRQVNVSIRGDIVEISPLRVATGDGEYTVFDAIRDNDGKGLKVRDLRKMLKKIA